jgi:hypothetical protein
MARFTSGFVVLTCLSLASACQDDAGPDSAPTDAAGDRDSRLAPPDPVYECEPNLPALQTGIFERGCAQIICHTSAGYAGSLDLVDTDPRKNLVDADSIVCRGWKRVVPGSPETSFLWNKLTTNTPACGDRMPLGLRPLPPHALECVRTWILELPREGDAGAR